MLEPMGWMLVTLLVALMAYRRTGEVVSPSGVGRRLLKVEMMLATLPAAEVLLGRIDELERKLDAAASPTKVVATLNAHSVDLLDVKRVLADVRQDVGKMRTGRSLTAAAGGG